MIIMYQHGRQVKAQVCTQTRELHRGLVRYVAKQFTILEVDVRSTQLRISFEYIGSMMLAPLLAHPFSKKTIF